MLSRCILVSQVYLQIAVNALQKLDESSVDIYPGDHGEALDSTTSITDIVAGRRKPPPNQILHNNTTSYSGDAVDVKVLSARCDILSSFGRREEPLHAGFGLTTAAKADLQRKAGISRLTRRRSEAATMILQS